MVICYGVLWFMLRAFVVGFVCILLGCDVVLATNNCGCYIGCITNCGDLLCRIMAFVTRSYGRLCVFSVRM